MDLEFTKSKQEPIEGESSKLDDGEEISPQENEERMWAALSFVVILIIIGVPLWWKMTEVERSYFPYDDIAELRHKNLTFYVNIAILVCKAPENLAENVKSLFSDSKLYDVEVHAYEFKYCEKEIQELEELVKVMDLKSSNIILTEVTSLKPREIVMGKHIAAYFSSFIEPEDIYNFLEQVLLHEKMLLESVKSVISPGLMSDNIDLLRKVRPSPKYDVIFTVVNPQPEKIHFKWSNEEIIEKYFRPVVRNLSLLSDFRIKSQWLYFVNLGQTPKKVADHFELTQIPHIITPLEKKIGSGVAQNPCINFVLYVTQCEYSPMRFVDFAGKASNALLSARWGAVQLVNPNQTHCIGAPLEVDSEAIMSTFIFQFRTLLGLRDLTSSGKILPSDTIVHPWEVKILYRMRVLELFTSSRITLTSLAELLGEINNIVITDQVGQAVVKAVKAAGNTFKSLEKKDLIGALNYSTEAFLASEFAFTHPSLLALLYFPDDQKYAVYIPLYLPVMIPVLLSLKNIVAWLKNKIKPVQDLSKKND